jgi:hypothetical protein
MIIVYEQNGIKILIPCTTELSLIQIGEKDIDLNIPFWIVNYDDLPSTPQETWKLENMGEPNGYGKRK